VAITQLPDTVKEAWGEPAVLDFATWLEGVMTERAVGPDEFVRVDARLTMVEHDLAEVKTEQREFRRDMNERFDRLQGQMNERFDRMYGLMDERFDRMDSRVNERFDRADERFDRMHAEVGLQLDRLHERMTSHMRWSVSLVAVFGTLVTILIALGQLRP